MAMALVFSQRRTNSETHNVCRRRMIQADFTYLHVLAPRLGCMVRTTNTAHIANGHFEGAAQIGVGRLPFSFDTWRKSDSEQIGTRYRLWEL
ncbi:hypothetical protein AM571_CH03803 [Rhizobium etli 8C-3]|uniref:Uncharacterized protein n=1 Tax=Rhizobium etli 8C-3 TaxID=538025 RepID=A0A1L5P8U7_RHIET|nr:hypothetical protein AM571_CH03803 [Rhizobium etli 8C-3]